MGSVVSLIPNKTWEKTSVPIKLHYLRSLLSRNSDKTAVAIGGTQQRTHVLYLLDGGGAIVTRPRYPINMVIAY